MFGFAYLETKWGSDGHVAGQSSAFAMQCLLAKYGPVSIMEAPFFWLVLKGHQKETALNPAFWGGVNS